MMNSKRDKMLLHRPSRMADRFAGKLPVVKPSGSRIQFTA